MQQPRLKENMNSLNSGSGALIGRRSGEYSQPRAIDYDKARHTATSGRRMLAKPAVNNLMTGHPELVLAVGEELDPGTEQRRMSMRNSMMQANVGGIMTRSWTRPIGSAGIELPYPGHLPTLGLIKRKRLGEDESAEVLRKGRYDKPGQNPFTREAKTD